MASDETTLACATSGAHGPREWIFDIDSSEQGDRLGALVASEEFGQSATGLAPPWLSVGMLELGEPADGSWIVGDRLPPPSSDEREVRPAPDVLEVIITVEREVLTLLDSSGGALDVVRSRRWVEAAVDPGPFRWRALGPSSQVAPAVRSARMIARALRDATARKPLAGVWIWSPLALAGLWHYFASRGLLDPAHLARPHFVIEPTRAAPFFGGDRVEFSPGAARVARNVVLAVIDSGSPPNGETARLSVLVRTSAGPARAQVDVAYSDMASALDDAAARGPRRQAFHLNGFDFIVPHVAIASVAE